MIGDAMTPFDPAWPCFEVKFDVTVLMLQASNFSILNHCRCYTFRCSRIRCYPPLPKKMTTTFLRPKRTTVVVLLNKCLKNYSLAKLDEKRFSKVLSLMVKKNLLIKQWKLKVSFSIVNGNSFSTSNFQIFCKTFNFQLGSVYRLKSWKVISSLNFGWKEGSLSLSYS